MRKNQRAKPEKRLHRVFIRYINDNNSMKIVEVVLNIIFSGDANFQNVTKPWNKKKNVCTKKSITDS